MKQQKIKKQELVEDISIAPISFTNRFLDEKQVIQQPLFRVLAKQEPRQKDIKIYSSHQAFSHHLKKDVKLFWRFDITEELSIFDFKVFIYLLNKYLQKENTEYIDIENYDNTKLIDFLDIKNNTYLCSVSINKIANDLGYSKPNAIDKKRIVDSLIRLQKVCVFFSDTDLSKKNEVPSQLFSKSMLFQCIENNIITFRLDNDIASFLLAYSGVDNQYVSLQYARYKLQEIKQLKSDISIALYNYLVSKNVIYTIDGLREVIYGFSSSKDNSYYKQRSSIKKGLNELKNIWSINIDGEKVYVIKK